MNDLTFVILGVAALFGAMLWLFFTRRKASKQALLHADLKGGPPLTLTRHYQYFPQIRLALSDGDRQYLLKSVPVPMAEDALRTRRAVARGFLKGLYEDYSNLMRAGRVIAALSPVVSREQETARLILSLNFQILYAVVWLRLSFGSLPIRQFEALTGLVGRLAARMEEALAQVNALSAGQLSGNARA